MSSTFFFSIDSIKSLFEKSEGLQMNVMAFMTFNIYMSVIRSLLLLQHQVLKLSVPELPYRHEFYYTCSV